jgi:HEAT repeat protein
LELTYVLEECHGYREEAIEKLGEIGPEAAAALPLLRRALEDPSERVREAARWALGRIEARDLQEGAK